MTPILISDKSWHYKLLQSTRTKTEDLWDICTYRNRVFLAIFKILAFIAIVSFILAGVIDVGMSFYFDQPANWWGRLIVVLFIAAVGGTAATAAIFGVAYLLFLTGDKFEHSNVKVMYKSWKEKHCAPIRIV